MVKTFSSAADHPMGTGHVIKQPCDLGPTWVFFFKFKNKQTICTYIISTFFHEISHSIIENKDSFGMTASNHITYSQTMISHLSTKTVCMHLHTCI